MSVGKSVRATFASDSFRVQPTYRPRPQIYVTGRLLCQLAEEKNRTVYLQPGQAADFPRIAEKWNDLKLLLTCDRNHEKDKHPPRPASSE